jgi:hypothetical protein
LLDMTASSIGHRNGSRARQRNANRRICDGGHITR